MWSLFLCFEKEIMQALLGAKIDQSQRFLEDGKRIPVTLVDVKDNRVVAVKTNDRDHYTAVQLGFGIKKNANRTELGHAKGAKLEKAPKFLREIRIMDDAELPEVGSTLNPAEVFEQGDIVNITGTSKGKGFAGVVKRWGFHGGPKTHGQSDRHRAPGSIGMGTTPGRVFKGKKMAGRMGNENVTIENLEIIEITADGVLVIKGLVPGIKKGFLIVNKIGEDKNFVPLYKEVIKEESKSEQSAISNQQSEKTTSESLVEDKEQVKEESSEATKKIETKDKIKAGSAEKPGKDEKEEVEKKVEEEKDASK